MQARSQWPPGHVWPRGFAAAGARALARGGNWNGADEIDFAEAALQEAFRVIHEQHAVDVALKQSSRCYFINLDLLETSESPWAALRDANNDMAYINLIRVNGETFRYIMGRCDSDWVARLEGYADARRDSLRRGPQHALRGKTALPCRLLTSAAPPSRSSYSLFSVRVRRSCAGASQMAWTSCSAHYVACQKLTLSGPHMRNNKIFSRVIACPFPGVHPWCVVDSLRTRTFDPNHVETQEL